MKQRFMYRVVIVQAAPGLKSDVSYLDPHRNLLTAEREAKIVSRQPLLKEARVLVEEFRQNMDTRSDVDWTNDASYLPVRTSQWQGGRLVFGLRDEAPVAV